MVFDNGAVVDGFAVGRGRPHRLCQGAFHSLAWSSSTLTSSCLWLHRLHSIVFSLVIDVIDVIDPSKLILLNPLKHFETKDAHRASQLWNHESTYVPSLEADLLAQGARGGHFSMF